MNLTLPTTPDRPLVLAGNAFERLQELPDDSIDAIITDPPYELHIGRMTGRAWDRSGIAFDPDFWAEVLRVLKPGGNLVAFGAARTVHRLTVALEDAGFEIRDGLIAWVSSYGFAKSLNIPTLLAKSGHLELAHRYAGVGTALKPTHEPIVLARKTPDGSIVQNIIRHDVGGLNIDATRIPTSESRARKPGTKQRSQVLHIQRGTERSQSHPGGRWPTNMLLVHRPECQPDIGCDSECPAAALDEQAPGSARFYPAFYYHGRAAESERPEVDGIRHLTVKPLALMEWLTSLVARPGQLILDPFAGSGSTIEAAMRLGIRAIGCEQESDYLPLIEHRIEREAARATHQRARA